MITKTVDFLNTVPFREKVLWFKLRIFPLFTSNRWCASHKTFSFLTSSFLGFGSIRWIWHITHKIQEDSISKKTSSWKVKLFDKSPFNSDLPALSLATKMGSSANPSSFLILSLCLLVFTQKSLAYFVTVSFGTLFDFDMKWNFFLISLFGRLFYVFVSNCRYSSVKIIATKLTDWFFILSTILWHLIERKIHVKFMNFLLKLFSKNCQEKISRTPHQKSSVNSNR